MKDQQVDSVMYRQVVMCDRFIFAPVFMSEKIPRSGSTYLMASRTKRKGKSGFDKLTRLGHFRPHYYPLP